MSLFFCLSEALDLLLFAVATLREGRGFPYQASTGNVDTFFPHAAFRASVELGDGVGWVCGTMFHVVWPSALAI